jgi:hypothetical protein
VHEGRTRFGCPPDDGTVKQRGLLRSPCARYEDTCAPLRLSTPLAPQSNALLRAWGMLVDRRVYGVNPPAGWAQDRADPPIPVRPRPSVAQGRSGAQASDCLVYCTVRAHTLV